MSKYGPLKMGDTRKDGMVFWGYRLGKELWVDHATYDYAILKKKLEHKCPNRKKYTKRK